MHHQVGVRDARVDRLDLLDGEDVAGGRTGELVGAVAGADGDGQGVHLGALDEVRRLFRVGEHLVVGQGAGGADAVFLTGLAGFQRAQAAQLAFHGDAAGVGHVHGATGHVHVVLILGGGLAVLAQGAVHHHRGEAQLDRALAHRGAGAVVLVHHQGDVRKLFRGGQNQVTQEGRAGVLPGAGAGLHDHR